MPKLLPNVSILINSLSCDAIVLHLWYYNIHALAVARAHSARGVEEWGGDGRRSGAFG